MISERELATRACSRSRASVIRIIIVSSIDLVTTISISAKERDTVCCVCSGRREPVCLLRALLPAAGATAGPTSPAPAGQEAVARPPARGARGQAEEFTLHKAFFGRWQWLSHSLQREGIQASLFERVQEESLFVEGGRRGVRAEECKDTFILYGTIFSNRDRAGLRFPERKDFLSLSLSLTEHASSGTLNTDTQKGKPWQNQTKLLIRCYFYVLLSRKKLSK